MVSARSLSNDAAVALPGVQSNSFLDAGTRGHYHTKCRGVTNTAFSFLARRSHDPLLSSRLHVIFRVIYVLLPVLDDAEPPAAADGSPQARARLSP